MWRQKAFDIIVVGAGPAGSTFANIAAQAGLSVLMLEKDREVGVPVRCGEGIADSGLRLFFKPQKRWIRSTITKCRFIAPDGTEFTAKPSIRGYILDRHVFDNDIAAIAAQNGTQVVTKAYVNGLTFDGKKVIGVKGKYEGSPFSANAKVVVGADGIESRVGRWAGIDTSVKLIDMASGVQKTITGIDVESDEIQLFVSKKWAPGGYIWVFPKGEKTANVGVCISGDGAKKGKSANQYLAEFLGWKYPNSSILKTSVGGVSISKTLDQIVDDGIMLVGDAARMVNPLTGSGITLGMKSAAMAAEVVVDIFKNNKEPNHNNLMEYQKQWMKTEGRQNKRFYSIKQAVSKLTDENLNAIAGKLTRKPEKELTLLRIFSACVTHKPSLLIDIAKVFAKN